MAAVELRGVTKAWGETRAVDGISFRVEPGHLVPCSVLPAAENPPRFV